MTMRAVIRFGALYPVKKCKSRTEAERVVLEFRLGGQRTFWLGCS